MRRVRAVVLAFGAVVCLAACSGQTTGTTNVTDVSATLTATASCDRGETCTWYWEYWRAGQPRSSSTKTAVYGPVNGPTASIRLSSKVANLAPNTTYDWVFCGSPNGGGGYVCFGPHGTVSVPTDDPPADYETFTTQPTSTLVEARQASTWTIQPAPNPAGSTGAKLSGVSCSSATACMAVGSYTDSTGTHKTLAESWDGTSWAIRTTPNPAGATSSSLSDVSCTAATACMAIGSSSVGPLAERWDGTGWTIQPMPSGGSVSAVSCLSATACTAVGTQLGTVSGNQASLTFAEHWDGTAWTVQTIADPTSLDAELVDVSCWSDTGCIATGNYQVPKSGPPPWYGTLAERWDGTSWTIEIQGGGDLAASLGGVSCTSAPFCEVVGEFVPIALPPQPTPIAESWDGTSWTGQSVPANVAGINRVSCTSPSACTALALESSSTFPPETQLFARWDGTSWTTEPPAKVTDRNPSLSALSCASADACTAVGSQ